MQVAVDKYRTNLGSVDKIKEFQVSEGLKPDGIVGPKTAMMFYNLKADKLSEICITDSRYTFDSLHRRKAPPSMVVIHDSISRNLHRTFNDLASSKPRALSTGFIIDYDGTIYQCCDVTNEVAIHAGALNDESIGIDLVNQLDPKLAFDSSDVIDMQARQRIVDADWSASSYMKHKAIDYTIMQKHALVRLCNLLSDVFNIPKVIPSELTGYGKCNQWVKESTYTGFIAHAQWSTKRWDGLLAVDHLMKNGYEAVNG